MSANEPADERKDAEWPRPYRINVPTDHNGASVRYWSHSLYRGPGGKQVQVLYSKDVARSEILAKMFLDESILGFDMEWPWNSDRLTRLQDKIGLIQIASEEKIALFHIGLHKGKTSEQLIAPALKKLIESPSIAKLGVNVLGSDFSRLSTHFGLRPQGALELSHIYRLVNYSQNSTELTTQLVALATQVQEKLGLPLSKGAVRTSNWSRPLRRNQIEYAAADAYAGLMLFHRMNAERMELEPVPSLPIFAERYPTKGRLPLLLQPENEDGETVVAKLFFCPPTDPATEDTEQSKPGVAPPAPMKVAEVTKSKTRSFAPNVTPTKVEKVTGPKTPSVALNAMETALYEKLAERRLVLARQRNLPAYMVASNNTLAGLASRRPLDVDELLEVKGIGKKTIQEGTGAEWLEIITSFSTNHSPVEPTTSAVNKKIPQRSSNSRPPLLPLDVSSSPSSSSSPLAFGSPVQRAPSMHTGLSFGFASSQIDADPGTTATVDKDSIPALVIPLPKSPPELKRKRPESPIKENKLAALAPYTPVPPISNNPQSILFRNKLVAFSRLVARKIPLSALDARPVVSEETLDLIVAATPRTWAEIYQIPDVHGFVKACDQAGMDLLKNVIKFAPLRS